MKTGRLTLTWIATLSLLTVGLAGVATPAASAAKLFRHLLESTPIAQEGDSTSMALDWSSGLVYIADINRKSGASSAVEVFDSEGGHVGQIARSFGSEALSVAVDNAPSSPSKDDVYIGDRSRGVVDKFKPVGLGEYEFVCEITGWGSGCHENPEPATEEFKAEGIEEVAVDGEGNLYVDDERLGFIDEFNSAGEDVVQLPATRAQDFAVDTHGNIYVLGISGATTTRVKIERGSFTGPAEHESVAPFFGLEGEVDPVTENVDIIHEPSGGVEEFKPAGELQLSFGEEERIRKFAVDGATDDIYALAAEGSRLYVFGVPVGLPQPISGEVSSVNSEGVILNGTVDPNGVPVTGCSFEYATVAFFEAHTSYEGSAPCTQSLGSLGSGESAIPVSAKLVVPPNTNYHWRLAASNASGTAEGVDQTFTSFRPPPAIGAGTVSNLTQFTATLNATLDPGGLPTGYHFEYGTSTAYGSVVPTPDLLLTTEDYTAHAVSLDISGLQAGTTYHYALVAQSAGGTVTGPDQTFTTPGISGPAVSTGGAEGVTVGAATLTGSIDGQGWETTYQFEYGTSTAYGTDWPTIGVALGALSGSQSVQSRVLNLLPGTVYHYRLVATNGGGVSYGPDETFTTAEYPTSVIQEAPLLKAPLGIKPEAKPRHPGKAKPKKHRRKTRARGKAKGKTNKKKG